MRVDVAARSPIKLVTTKLPAFSIVRDKPIYNHTILWEPQAGCPEGFLVQKIVRDIKFSTGSLNARNRWEWTDVTAYRASYWELWEVVNAAAGNGNPQRVRIYPGIVGVSAGPELYSTSRGLSYKNELESDTNKRPHSPAENRDYNAHDVFAESLPKHTESLAIKGTFKIKGTVYMLRSGPTGEHPWATAFLTNARRSMRFALPDKSCYTGGPLWQRSGEYPAPGDGPIITRYEAGEFYDVRASHLKPSCTNPPAIQFYCRSRAYPHHGDNVRFAYAATP